MLQLTPFPKRLGCILALLLPGLSCSDGETGSGVQVLDLQTYCEGTCEARTELQCDRDPTRELCESRCLMQPFPEPGADCYEETLAILHCEYENRDSAFECNHSGRSEPANDTCAAEYMRAAVNCGGL